MVNQLEKIFPEWMPEGVQALIMVFTLFFVTYHVVRFLAKMKDRKDYFRRETFRIEKKFARNSI